MKKQEIILTIGLPASGKTTWLDEFIKQHPEYININRDDIRIMLQGRSRYAKFSRWREGMVTDTMLTTAKAAVKEGKSVIISDTNLNKNRNKAWEKFAKDRKIDYVEKLFTDVPVGVCIERDMKRLHPVGAKVIMGFFERGQGVWWHPPVYDPNLPDCYIVDVDGTLAQMVNRSPYDWMKVDTDLPKQDVIAVVNALKIANPNVYIIAASGRDGICKDLTSTWLTDNHVLFDKFYIRPEGDNRKDTLIKEEIYHKHIKGNYNVIGVFDDRDQVVHMWRHLGLTVFQVNYGAF